jgi:hypothetical protein
MWRGAGCSTQSDTCYNSWHGRQGQWWQGSGAPNKPCQGNCRQWNLHWPNLVFVPCVSFPLAAFSPSLTHSNSCASLLLSPYLSYPLSLLGGDSAAPLLQDGRAEIAVGWHDEGRGDEGAQGYHHYAPYGDCCRCVCVCVCVCVWVWCVLCFVFCVRRDTDTENHVLNRSYVQVSVYQGFLPLVWRSRGSLCWHGDGVYIYIQNLRIYIFHTITYAQIYTHICIHIHINIYIHNVHIILIILFCPLLALHATGAQNRTTSLPHTAITAISSPVATRSTLSLSLSLSIYVCMHVCMYVCMYILYIHICLYIYICMYVCMYVCIYYIYIYVYIYTYVCMYVYVDYIYTYILLLIIYVCMYVCMYIYIIKRHTHVSTCMYMYICSCKFYAIYIC